MRSWRPSEWFRAGTNPFRPGRMPCPGAPPKTGDRLEAADALELVRRAREQSKTLPVLRTRMEALFRGRRCCLIGSAPGGTVPPRRPGDRFLCVNGSVSTAVALGVPMPDLTAITGYATHSKRAVPSGYAQAWRGRRTGELVFVSNGDTEDHARELFAEVDFKFGRFTALTAYERAAILGDATGLELGLGPRDQRVSMGIFAAVLALWGGRRRTRVLRGFAARGAQPPRRRHASPPCAGRHPVLRAPARPGDPRQRHLPRIAADVRPAAARLRRGRGGAGSSSSYINIDIFKK
jgi:hypothetical protein